MAGNGYQSKIKNVKVRPLPVGIEVDSFQRGAGSLRAKPLRNFRWGVCALGAHHAQGVELADPISSYWLRLFPYQKIGQSQL